MVSLNVGVLALQGAFSKHIEMLQKLNVNAMEIRRPEELDSCEGLIIPGGESTTILKQMGFIHLTDKLKEFSLEKPIFGTCAGLILMAQEIVADKRITPLGILDISVERNAFGRQLESFNTDIEVSFNPSNPEIFPAFFIRAPRIRSCSSSVNILSTYENEPILIRQGIHLGATFHPELTDNPSIHAYFLELIKKTKKNP